MKRLLIVLAALSATSSLYAATDVPSESVAVLPSMVPQVKLPQDAPQGVVKQLSYSASRIFPGTVHDVSVFIPAQYDGSKPACVYLKMDGNNPKGERLLEGLIAGGFMPVTVGVFVKPGVLPAPYGTKPLGRPNRIFEYDSLGDSNARFFIEELLPFVAKELNLNLSTSGNDRCIAGGSSGGIAAFNAAWERPDAFSRVYAVSPSFVAELAGCHELSTLVYKTEAKPIRVYLTTGTHDVENFAGDHFLSDQEMAKALKFSGYDYMFRMIEGGHGAGAVECAAEALAFLWKDWPKPVPTGRSAPSVRNVILPGESWQLASSGYRAAQGAAVNAVGEVFFTDAPDNKVYRIGLDGSVKEFLSDAGFANDVSVGAHGEIYTVSSRTGKIMSYTPAGKGSLITDGLPGHSILAAPKGEIYVTCPGQRLGEPSTVWLVRDGKKTQVDSGLKRATGLACRPDQWFLSVADGGSKWVYSYQVDSDGMLVNKERFFSLHVPDWEDDAGAESVCCVKGGPMLVATYFGIQVCDGAGMTEAILPMPDRSRVLGVCLGGPGGDTLFAFCGDKIWKRKVKAHAPGVEEKVNGSRLSP
jgi:gluconolactonase